MVNLVKRGEKISKAFAKKKATPKFSAITVTGDSAHSEISQSVKLALHFSDGTSYWLSEVGMQITHFSGYDASDKNRVAWMLRNLADRLLEDAEKFSKQYDEDNK